MINFVEILSSADEDSAFDQACTHGHRVGGHAVYCHNGEWNDAPRKCRRTWAFGEDYARKHGLRDEDCPGFTTNCRLQANHNHEGRTEPASHTDDEEAGT